VGVGRFRADLYHRLAVVILEVPPLRYRGQDAVLLAEHFLASHAAAHGVAPKRLDAGARAWLLTCDWPGNVRELSHLMERVRLLVPDDEVGRDTLERLRIPLTPAPAPTPSPSAPADEGEAARIRAALARTGGNVVRAARLLGLGRNALRHRMRRHGIDRPPPADPEQPRADAGHVPAAADAPRPEPRWEQRPVAALAIDLVVPDDAVEPWTTVRRWERMVGERVSGFGGAMVTRSPSRLTAVFGVPRALEQLPQRAVLAALAIRRLALEDDPLARPALRMAVHAGAVRVDHAARDVGGGLVPVGDTLALPERLLGHAGAGEILVSPAVAHRVEGWCVLRGRELRIGEADTLRAHAVLARRPQPGADSPAATGQTRFVGRQRELDLLRGTFDGAAAGLGQVVFLVGEAGVGEAGPPAEVSAGVADVPPRRGGGRRGAHGAPTAFLPVIDGLRRLWGIDDQDDEARAGAKVDAAVAALGDDLRWTLPFLRHVLGLAVDDPAAAALDSASRRSETFRALKALT